LGQSCRIVQRLEFRNESFGSGHGLFDRFGLEAFEIVNLSLVIINCAALGVTSGEGVDDLLPCVGGLSGVPHEER